MDEPITPAEATLQTLDLIQSQGKIIDLLCDLVERHFDQYDAELAELRDGLVDQDHRLADLRREHAATRQVVNSLQEDAA